MWTRGLGTDIARMVKRMIVGDIGRQSVIEHHRKIDTCIGHGPDQSVHPGKVPHVYGHLFAFNCNKILRIVAEIESLIEPDIVRCVIDAELFGIVNHHYAGKTLDTVGLPLKVEIPHG